MTFALCSAAKVRPAGPSAAACPTCRGGQHVRGVAQSHEIKLVEPPVLLVGRGHRVLAPLVDDLVSRVTVWKGGVQSRKDKGQRRQHRREASFKQAGFNVIQEFPQQLG